MFATAKATNRYDELFVGDLVAYLGRVQPASFDVIVAGDVFGYVGELSEVVPLAANALRPGRMIVLTVDDATETEKPPYLASLDEITIRANEADEFVMMPRGTFAYTPAYLDRVLTAAHLRPEIQRCFLRIEVGKAAPGLLVQASA